MHRLDGVIDYLPQPDEVENVALLTDDNEKPFMLDVSKCALAIFIVLNFSWAHHLSSTM